ncbi:unnamed protein product [Gongylonema pulchrum]|uniref:ZT_dimer domain-containing protein n=1 Tax=Gongylonema pulchrum TaxID=637853 RepID=A0A183CYU3_9BILA|nr:unnamed protein product [Gongylonema pulchrum]
MLILYKLHHKSFICGRKFYQQKNRAVEVKKIKDEESLRRFMLHHGENVVNRIADEVDRIEEEIVKKHPDVKHVDLEPL